MNDNSIIKSNLIVKLRPNLYQLPLGQLVGFGQREAENGISWCYNCQESECQHVTALTEAWLGGMSVDANTIPFNGETPADDSDPDGMIFASSAGLFPDEYGIEEPTI